MEESNGIGRRVRHRSQQGRSKGRDRVRRSGGARPRRTGICPRATVAARVLVPRRATRGAAARVGQRRSRRRRSRAFGAAGLTQPVERAVGHDGGLLHDPGRLDDRRGRQPQHHGEAAPTTTPSSGSPAPTCWPMPCRCWSGRLGDQFGPKNLYLIGCPSHRGLTLWCGLAGSIETLIAARVVQGTGRGAADAADAVDDHPDLPARTTRRRDEPVGATAGVATLVGPLAGGILVDHLGWQWIFIVNVPDRHHRSGSGLLVDPGAADQPAPV